MKRFLTVTTLAFSGLALTNTSVASMEDINGNTAFQGYQKCNESVVAQNFEAAWQCVSNLLKSDDVREMNKTLFQRMLPTRAQYVARDLKLLDEQVSTDGQAAILQVEGTVKEMRTQADSRQKGEVQLRLEDGVWRISREMWGNQAQHAANE